AGQEAFEQAIDKSAMILRRHSKSKWTDDALLLMGKSYYYLQEFSAAADRFEQVRKENSELQLKHAAMVWKGKALLNMKDYAGGIHYLEPILQRYSVPRDFAPEGELQLLMGEYTADRKSTRLNYSTVSISYVFFFFILYTL